MYLPVNYESNIHIKYVKKTVNANHRSYYWNGIIDYTDYKLK